MTTRQIILTAPGIQAVGDYRPGVVYTVPAEEATRLVAVKGFCYADEPEALPESHYPPHVIEPALPSEDPARKGRRKP